MAKKMTNSGKALETLIAFLEKLKLPDGFVVETNKRLQDKVGNDEAEFDIVISGNIGSAKMVWLIECRDRPSQRSAPVAWIEQLVGRRDRFQINKVTAVSTQPFSRPAQSYASERGIDLRRVKSLAPGEFSDWLHLPFYTQTTRYAHLKHANILLPDDIADEVGFAVGKRLQATRPDESFLRSTKDNCSCRPENAYLGLIEQEGLFEDLVPNGPRKNVNIFAKYTNSEDCYMIDTDVGAAQVDSIQFFGELFCVSESVPLKSVFEYQDVESNLVLSQTATFESKPIANNQWALRLHRDAESGRASERRLASRGRL